MRWVVHVAHGGGRREDYTGFWLRVLRERDDLEGPDIDGRIILTFRHLMSTIVDVLHR